MKKKECEHVFNNSGICLRCEWVLNKVKGGMPYLTPPKGEISTPDDRLSLKQIFGLMDVNLDKLEKLAKPINKERKTEIESRNTKFESLGSKFEEIGSKFEGIFNILKNLASNETEASGERHL